MILKRAPRENNMKRQVSMLTSQYKNTQLHSNNGEKYNSSNPLPHMDRHTYTQLLQPSRSAKSWFLNKRQSSNIDSNVLHNLHQQGSADTHLFPSLCVCTMWVCVCCIRVQGIVGKLGHRIQRKKERKRKIWKKTSSLTALRYSHFSPIKSKWGVAFHLLLEVSSLLLCNYRCALSVRLRFKDLATTCVCDGWLTGLMLSEGNNVRNHCLS